MGEFTIGELWLMHRALRHLAECPRLGTDAIEHVAIRQLSRRLHQQLDAVALDHLTSDYQEEPDALKG